MNWKLSVLKIMALVGLFLTIQPAQGKVKARRLAPVAHRDEPAKKVNFYGNPLTLNGKPLNYSSFSMSSRGILAVVEGDPGSKDATKVPFRVYLKRAGAVVTPYGSDNTQPVYYEIEMAAVLALARPGDDLVIEPTRKPDLVAKRVIKLRPLNTCLPPNWLFFSVNGLPGC
ncbi:hypothetical protein [Spirosoma migulaei]